ncbi:hypothetical protein [Variovorax sp. YR216]|uniref:hypothetical protein n=1 Tax=Variovorax sp. YR216 TaxID=1882828 RepID=UPI00089540BB|nr:hypothetical protein [Variovorax sp. YR216]SEA04445.1 hypothetical protein SAMN05444680_101313 [Variovorax sp. YR216]
MTVWRFPLAALAVVLAAGCATGARQQAMADARIDTVEAGAFDLWVGPSATQGLKTSFVLAEPD